MSKIKAGMVAVSKYTFGSSKKFNEYINYVDRTEAQRNKGFDKYNMNTLDGYNQYMGNPEKTGGLFTALSDHLNETQCQTLKKSYQEAQKNDSLMWQDVISFDNRFLEKHGLYNSETSQLDEATIRSAVRLAQQKCLANEGMEHSAIWSAAIHYNTDNIHIHIATVEPIPTREYKTFTNKKTGKTYEARKGNRHKGTLDIMKSQMMANLIDRSEELKKISELTRQTFVPREFNFNQLYHYQLGLKYEAILEKLPQDKRLWKYNMNALNDIKPLINDYIDTFIQYYHQDDMKELQTLLKEQVLLIEEAYGKGTKEAGRSKEFEQNKMNELYTRLGNALLKDMSQVDTQRKLGFQSKLHTANGSGASSLFKQLGHLLKQTKQHQRNQRHYQQLIDEIERER